jgi:hypothetical protein
LAAALQKMMDDDTTGGGTYVAPVGLVAPCDSFGYVKYEEKDAK